AELPPLGCTAACANGLHQHGAGSAAISGDGAAGVGGQGHRTAQAAGAAGSPQAGGDGRLRTGARTATGGGADSPRAAARTDALQHDSVGVLAASHNTAAAHAETCTTAVAARSSGAAEGGLHRTADRFPA